MKTINSSAKPVINYRKFWNKFPFVGFNLKVLEERRVPWYEAAEDTIKNMQFGNVAIISGTSSGKTIMAILASYFHKRVLFVTSMRVLTVQHAHLYEKIIGSRDGVQVLNGGFASDKRNWSNCKMTFATPEVLVNDFIDKKVKIDDYDLIILDEFDLGVGNHAIANVARIAKLKQVQLLCLSATLGDKKTEEEIMVTCAIKAIVQPLIPTPEKYEYLHLQPLTPHLKQIDEIFKCMMVSDAEHLKSYLPKEPKSDVFLQRELKMIYNKIKALPREQPFYDSMNIYARYYKLLHAYRICLTESYEVFQDYVMKLQDDDKKAAEQILTDKRFHAIQELVQEDSLLHPKIAGLKLLMDTIKSNDFSGIVFIRQKDTARHLKEYFDRTHFIKTELYLGGRKNKADRAKDEETLAKLSSKEIHAVFTTVLDRGLDSKADMVIQYSMPRKKAGRIQSAGRAGRFGTGYVYYICLDHPLDKGYYFATNTKRKKKAKKKVYFFQKNAQLSLF